ncbi:MAG: cytochrome c biogenesis protein CcsA [Prosthecobacter sp.]|nr:cytochrome c biogenesis protein CcsA [Prosthecobacter sp.]
MRRFFLACLLLLASFASAQQLPEISTILDKDVVAAFQSMPIQEGGRIKPLDTYARFLLLRMHGKQSIAVKHEKLPDYKKLKAIEWLILSWFRPDIARELPLFVVDNSQAVGEIGVDPKDLRDRYSWSEIVKGREELIKRAQAYSEIETAQQTGVQRNVINLARNFFDYDAVSDFMTAARTDWKKEISSILSPELAKEIVGDAPSLSVWELAVKLGAMSRENKIQGGSEESQKILNLFIDTTLRPGKTLAFIPPDDAKEEVWLQVEQTVTNLMREGKIPEGELAVSKARDGLYAASLKAETFKPAVKAFVDDIRARAEKRGELSQIDREVRYHRTDYFTNALVWYLLGFLVATLGLVAPQSKLARWTSRIAWIAVLLGVGYNVWGITQRCIIMGRPPIATLYETIIFIAASCALVGLFIEKVTRKGVVLAVVGFVGALGMFLSNRFMALDGQDTMPTLEAVLITNFWLATHVTCINIGYAGALLGSITSMVYVIFRFFAKGEQSVEFRRLLTRITYGIMCFGLLFALVGTVLGGIWANDSWGRFWGWDPKENGALMIVLMGLIILHARLGGYIREIGLHALSLLLGAITLFSWFGVNQLSIGLHSYGFTAGITLALNIGYSTKFVFMLACGWFWLQERAAKKAVA